MVNNLDEAIARREAFTLGELRVEFDGDCAIIHGPEGEGPEMEVPGEPSAIREWVRADAFGRYRPLTGARTMRPAWRCRLRGESDLLAALDAIYPLASRHIELWEMDHLPLVTLEAVLSRQSGRYEAAATLSADGRNVASGLLCGMCVRTPAWRGDAVPVGGIPCPEPCSVLVSLCREAALWEASPPSRAAVDPSVPFAAFDTPGNELRELYLRRRFPEAAGPAHTG